MFLDVLYRFLYSASAFSASLVSFAGTRVKCRLHDKLPAHVHYRQDPTNALDISTEPCNALIFSQSRLDLCIFSEMQHRMLDIFLRDSYMNYAIWVIVCGHGVNNPKVVLICTGNQVIM